MHTYAGAPCQIEHVDGIVMDSAFPAFIAPRQPFIEIRAIRSTIAPGVQAEVRFTGDVFEMENQRNWTDASFKTYATPLSRPYPVEVPAGTRIAQSVTLTLNGAPARVPDADRPIMVTFDRDATYNPYVAESGAASVTYYETSGWRGVMETEAGAPLPECFRSIPGAVFPLYHALADVGACAGGDVLPSLSSRPLLVESLALHKDGRTRIMLVNFSDIAQVVAVHDMPERVRVLSLDETKRCVKRSRAH